MDTKLYEGMFIIHPGDHEAESRSRVLEEVKSEIIRQNGSVVHVHSMGKRDFTYPIKRYQDGYYYLIYFSVPPLGIQKMKEKYKINTSILREMLLVIDELPAFIVKEMEKRDSSVTDVVEEKAAVEKTVPSVESVEVVSEEDVDEFEDDDIEDDNDDDSDDDK